MCVATGLFLDWRVRVATGLFLDVVLKLRNIWSLHLEKIRDALLWFIVFVVLLVGATDAVG
jgi:hypothetical protein